MHDDQGYGTPPETNSGSSGVAGHTNKKTIANKIGSGTSSTNCG